MQDRCHADLGPQMFWIGSDCQQSLRHRLEPQAVDHSLVLICDIRDPGWQSEDRVELLAR